MEESIYHIIPPEKPKPYRPKMYHSQFPALIDPTGSTFNNKTTASPGINNVSGDYQRSLATHNYQN